MINKINDFTDGDKVLLEDFANHVGIVLENTFRHEASASRLQQCIEELEQEREALACIRADLARSAKVVRELSAAKCARKLLGISKVVAAHTELDGLFRTIVHEAGVLLGAEKIILYLADAEQSTLISEMIKPPSTVPMAIQTSIAPGVSIASHVAYTKRLSI